MTSNETIFTSLPSPSTNRAAVISLVLGLLTLIFFCGGWVPLPFTGFICFPVSIFTGLLAVIYGTSALYAIRKNNEAGSPMAWVGILSGGMIFLCLLCFIILLASLFFYSPETMQPLIDGYQL